jgi:hypothetical protein
MNLLEWQYTFRLITCVRIYLEGEYKYISVAETAYSEMETFTPTNLKTANADMTFTRGCSQHTSRLVANVQHDAHKANKYIKRRDGID